NIISGTSMASPHVAGLLAYHLSTLPSTLKSNPLASSIPGWNITNHSNFIAPADLKAEVIKLSSQGLLS
ncbi:hypothetical protein B0F90DRAFT_1753243, partial [Multifurca ochricompacta]